jgi:hypothetical protein
VLLVAVLWPTNKTELFGGAFLRGVTGDLAVLADSPARHNLVFSYHFSTRWYVEDALVTSQPGGRTYDVVPETYTDRSAYEAGVVAAAVAAQPSGTAVWCVMPYDLGPELTEEACPVPPGLTPLHESRHDRSTIKGYLKP